MKDRIIAMLGEGRSYREIVAAVGCSTATISYHAHKQGRAVASRPTYDWEEVQRFHEEGHSLEECRARFGFCKASWQKAKERGALTVRRRGAATTEILVAQGTASRGTLKRRMIGERLVDNCCAQCGLTMWQGQEIRLQLHHKNGICNDHRLHNLELLCPNCHSLTETFCGKNVKRKKQRLR